MSQSGKVTSAGAPPFATADGRSVVNDGGKKGNDFSANPSGNGSKEGEANVSRSRKQETPPTGNTPAASPHLQSRPQQPGSAAQRVDPRSIAPGGIVPKADPGAAARAIGAQGLGTRSPFKNMR